MNFCETHSALFFENPVSKELEFSRVESITVIAILLIIFNCLDRFEALNLTEKYQVLWTSTCWGVLLPRKSLNWQRELSDIS